MILFPVIYSNKLATSSEQSQTLSVRVTYSKSLNLLQMGWSLLPTMYCMAVCIQNQKTSLCIPNKKCVVDSNNGTYISIGIGSKKFPIHFLVIHGSVKIRNPPAIKMDLMKEWFKSEGQVEGIVWHCANGTLFKVTIYLTFQLKLKLFYLIRCLFL